jgi:hypothetical protein
MERESEPGSLLVQASCAVCDLLVCAAAHGVPGLLLDEVKY